MSDEHPHPFHMRSLPPPGMQKLVQAIDHIRSEYPGNVAVRLFRGVTRLIFGFRLAAEGLKP